MESELQADYFGGHQATKTNIFWEPKFYSIKHFDNIHT